MEKSREQKISKFLSYILRHNPEKIGIKLNGAGWTDVKTLIDKSKSEIVFDFNELKYVVQNNDKKRFELSNDFCSLRCSQGHSVKVDLDYKATTPPHILYHGTPLKVLPTIRKEGLKKMARHHTHLSESIETAEKVGARRGNFEVLEIEARLMHFEGYKFYKSTNGVWLTDHVPTQYIKFNG